VRRVLREDTQSESSHACSASPYTSADRNAYYHPLFVRDDRDLCRYIRRVKCKGDGPRKPSNPQDQPDFYSDRDPFRTAALSSRAARPPTKSPARGNGSFVYTNEPKSTVTLFRLPSSVDATFPACIPVTVPDPALSGINLHAYWGAPSCGRLPVLVGSGAPAPSRWICLDGSAADLHAPPPPRPQLLLAPPHLRYHQILREALGASMEVATMVEPPPSRPVAPFETSPRPRVGEGALQESHVPRGT
jgi:hypothetical protein